MPLLLPTDVQRRPFAVPVEGYAILTLVEIIEVLEVFVFNGTSTVDIEQSEGDLVLSVWLCKKILERAPVVQVDSSSIAPICHAEEYSILLTLNLMLGYHLSQRLISEQPQNCTLRVLGRCARRLT